LQKVSNYFLFYETIQKKDDAPHIAEAKKMFINFAVAGFAVYYQQCTEDQLTRLHQFPNFAAIVSHAAKTISVNNSKKNIALQAEMQKYTDPILSSSPTPSK